MVEERVVDAMAAAATVAAAAKEVAAWETAGLAAAAKEVAEALATEESHRA
jgi:hypothetical protein